MSPVPKYESADDVDKHTERALLFSKRERVIDKNFSEMMADVKSGGVKSERDYDYSEDLKIRWVPTGLPRLQEQEDEEKFYENSIWIVDYDLLSGECELGGPVDELRKKVYDNLCPDIVEVRVFVNDAPRKADPPLSEEIAKNYRLHRRCTFTNYNALVGSLCTYFGSIDPGTTAAGRERNYKWSKYLHELAL